MKKILALSVAVLLTGCTHTQMLVKDTTDDRLTCTEIAAQSAEAKMVLKDIDEKTGFSGRNVALGLFFWPGIIVNQMNAGDARKAATERLGVLTDLSKARACS
jgi:hypothetical protein